MKDRALLPVFKSNEISVSKCFAFEEESLCVVNHESQLISYHDSVSVVMTSMEGTPQMESLIESGRAHSLCDKIEVTPGVFQWVIDSDSDITESSCIAITETRKNAAMENDYHPHSALLLTQP